VVVATERASKILFSFQTGVRGSILHYSIIPYVNKDAELNKDYAAVNTIEFNYTALVRYTCFRTHFDFDHAEKKYRV